MEIHRVIVVSFIKLLEQGFMFTEWPNHVTIVPYFQTSNPQKLIFDIRAICATLNTILYTVGNKDFFGTGGSVEVSKIVPNRQISILHQLLLNVALKNDSDMEVKYCLENYKPHITHNFQPYPKEKEGDILQTLYIVENYSSEAIEKSLQKKSILAVINLQSK